MTTITSQLSNNYKITLKVSQSSQNMTNNTSSLSWTYQISCGSAYYQNSSTKDIFKAVINGTTVLNVSKAISFSGPNTTITIASGTLNVSHNTDGTKTVNMSCSYTPGRSASYYPSSMNANGTMKLTTIPRKSSISTNVSSQYPDKNVKITISKASSSFTHTLKYSCGSLSGTIATKTSNSSIVWTIPINFIDQSPNKIQTCTLTCLTYSGSTNIGSTTKTITIQNYEESVISECHGKVIGEMINLTINRQHSAFTHQLKYSLGSCENVLIASSAKNNVEFCLPENLCDEIPNSVSGDLIIQITTYYGSIVIGNIKRYVYSVELPSSVLPKFESVSHNEANEDVKSLSLGAYIQHKTKLSLSIDGIDIGRGATLKSCKIEVAGQTIKAKSGVTEVITKEGDFDIKATIINSRGQSYSKTFAKAITVLPYSPPTLTDVIGSRDDDTNATINASIVAKSIKVNNIEKNIVKYKIKYDSNNAHDISELFEKEVSKKINVQIPNLDKTKSYQVKVYAGDIFGFINTYEMLSIPTGNVGYDFDTKTGRVAVGKYLEAGTSYSLETAKSIISREKIISDEAIYTGGKTTTTDGKAGGVLNASGNLHLNGLGGPGVYFYYANATNYTHILQARSDDFYMSKTLVANGNLEALGNNIRVYRSSNTYGAGMWCDRTNYAAFYLYDANGWIARMAIYPTYFQFDKKVQVDGSVVLTKANALWVKDTNGTNKSVCGISSSNNLFIGASETYGTAGNTYIYGDNYIKFMANRSSDSYKAGVVEIFREQSDPYRTILRPATNGNAYLGTTSYRWNTAFFTNAITASDLKEKEVIDDFDFKVKDFMMRLEPIAYYRKGEGDTGERIHMGFGAQTIAQLIKDLQLGNMSLVQASITSDGEEHIYHGEEIDDKNLSWGLNYNELIAPMVLMIQQQQNEIDELKKQIQEIIKKG